MASLNPLLAALDVRPEDRVVSIREHGGADSNFVITYLMKQILTREGARITLVLFHNTIGHYHNVGKRLGYDFFKKVEEGVISVIDPLKDLVEDFDSGTRYFMTNKEEIVKGLFVTIKKIVEGQGAAKKKFLIVDDLSHLLDLGVDLRLMVGLTTYCVGLSKNSDVSVIINNHLCSTRDQIVSTSLNYMSDVVISVFPLQTGISSEVTGLLTVERGDKCSKFHFKTFDKGVKTFNLGESVYNLYK